MTGRYSCASVLNGREEKKKRQATVLSRSRPRPFIYLSCSSIFRIAALASPNAYHDCIKMISSSVDLGRRSLCYFWKRSSNLNSNEMLNPIRSVLIFVGGQPKYLALAVQDSICSHSY